MWHYCCGDVSCELWCRCMWLLSFVSHGWNSGIIMGLNEVHVQYSVVVLSHKFSNECKWLACCIVSHKASSSMPQSKLVSVKDLKLMSSSELLLFHSQVMEMTVVGRSYMKVWRVCHVPRPLQYWWVFLNIDAHARLLTWFLYLLVLEACFV